MGPVVEATEDEVRVVIADDTGWRVWELTETGAIVLVEEVSV